MVLAVGCRRLYYCCLIYNIYINYCHDPAVPSCDHLLELDLRALCHHLLCSPPLAIIDLMLRLNTAQLYLHNIDIKTEQLFVFCLGSNDLSNTAPASPSPPAGELKLPNINKSSYSVTIVPVPFKYIV